MDTPPPPLPQVARTSERAREVLLVSYTIDENHAPEYTETYDIAIGGLAMMTNAALAPNRAIVIDLELRGDPRPKLRLNANVRWSTLDPLIGKYRTGVSFIDQPDDFERELVHYIDTLHNLRDLGAI
jgi:c-di-GMP-binding flagellar brake protein YcgR